MYAFLCKNLSLEHWYAALIKAHLKMWNVKLYSQRTSDS